MTLPLALFSSTPLEPPLSFSSMDLIERLSDLIRQGSLQPVIGFIDEQHVFLDSTPPEQFIDKTGETPLTLAIKEREEEIANTFIEKEFCIFHLNHENFSPLEVAAERYQFSLVEKLLPLYLKNLEPSSTRYSDQCALLSRVFLFCVKGDYVDPVDTLLMLDLNLDLQDNYGKTPLMIAIEREKPELALKLIEKGVYPDIQNNEKRTALMLACFKGYEDIVNALIRKEAALDLQNIGGWTALVIAAYRGYQSIVRDLILAHADIEVLDLDKKNALMWATEAGHLFIVEDLLRQKASVNQQDNRGKTALMIAAEKGDVEITRLLLKAKANLRLQNDHQLNALMIAIRAGHEEIINILVEAGAKVNPRGSSKWTPLHFAVERGNTPLVEQLIEQNARIDTHSPKPESLTPLMIAAREGHTQIIDTLVQAQNEERTLSPLRLLSPLRVLSPNRGDSPRSPHSPHPIKTLTNFFKPFPFFHRKNSSESTLLDDRNRHNQTALMIAVQHNQLTVVEKLLQLGASTSPHDHFNFTALTRALHHSQPNPQIITLLLEKEALNKYAQADFKIHTLISKYHKFVQAQRIELFNSYLKEWVISRSFLYKVNPYKQTAFEISYKKGCHLLLQDILSSLVEVESLAERNYKDHFLEKLERRDPTFADVQFFFNNQPTVFPSNGRGRKKKNCCSLQ